MKKHILLCRKICYNTRMYKRSDFDIVIGMEFHAQANCLTKLFSPASANFDDEPDTNVALTDAGMPGCLPVVNKAAIYKGVRTALAFNMIINDICGFDRKHYTYPDLPLGYQITQQNYPLGYDGHLILENGSKIRFERLSLESDAAKNIHQGDHTYVDLNRSGVCLMEIVTAPDIRSPEEMIMTFKKVRNILRIIKTSNADMFKGELRADVNVSINLKGQPYGERVEIKNINSVQYAYQALEYEIARHIDLINKGESVILETRTFDPNTGTTKAMRTKEQAADYRFFREANIPYVKMDREYVAKVKSELPELLDDIIARWSDLGISRDNTLLLSQESETIEFLNECIDELNRANVKMYDLCAILIAQEIFGMCNNANIAFADMKITPKNLTQLVLSIHKEIISGKQAKDVIKEMFEAGKECDTIIKDKNLSQITDANELTAVIKSVMEKNPDVLQRYLSGNTKLLGFFVGQVMIATENKANPKLLNELLIELLK